MTGPIKKMALSQRAIEVIKLLIAHCLRDKQ
jgi:hypothetical protein